MLNLSKKRWFIVAIMLFVCSFTFSFVSAESVSLSSVNSTYSTVSISNAENLYAYEINFDYTGSVDGVDQNNFLGPTTNAFYGTDDDGTSIYTVFGSILNSSDPGVTGDGDLFNISFNESVSLRFAIFVDASGDDEVVYYNASAEEEAESSSSDSSGGSGGGSDETPIPPPTIAEIDFSVQPEDITTTLISTQSDVRELIFVNNILQSYDISLSIEGDELRDILVLPDSFTLEPGENNLEMLFSPAEKGLITGTIVVSYGNIEQYRIPVVINLRSENFLFDSSISVVNQFRRISVGDALRAQINLLQVGPNEKVDVTATYVVKDFAGTVYIQESETFFVLGSKDFVKELPTADLPPGEYIVGLEIVYPGAFATASAQFKVAQSNTLNTIFYIILGLVVILVLIFIVVFVNRNQKRRAYRKKRRSYRARHRKKK